MPKPLNLDRLKKFDNRAAAKADLDPVGDREGQVTERWPSREPLRDGQISIKASLDVLDRFKRICKDDRRTYADMLRILMDLYEGR